MARYYHKFSDLFAGARDIITNYVALTPVNVYVKYEDIDLAGEFKLIREGIIAGCKGDENNLYYHEGIWSTSRDYFNSLMKDNQHSLIKKHNKRVYLEWKREKEEHAENDKKEREKLIVAKRKREENVEALLVEIRDILLEMNEPSQKRLKDAMNELNL